MKPDAIIISLAYPKTIVMIPEEWYAKYMHYFGIGTRNYVRAGHAALVLIDINGDELEYYDFGRYITPLGFGRLRNKVTDHELDFPIKADIVNGELNNLPEILHFLATHPKLTHGNGPLVASVCKSVNYQKAKAYLSGLQHEGLVRYAAFIKDATNCSRLVSEVLIRSCTDSAIIAKLRKANRFTPSTAGTVVIANTCDNVYKVSEKGNLSIFKDSVKKQNARLFLDRLKDHDPDLKGTLEPKPIAGLNDRAQWLSGIGAGAWFELFEKDVSGLYRFRRISGEGEVDTDSLYKIDDESFTYQQPFQVQYRTNCNELYIQQYEKQYRFKFIRKLKTL